MLAGKAFDRLMETWQSGMLLYYGIASVQMLSTNKRKSSNGIGLHVHFYHSNRISIITIMNFPKFKNIVLSFTFYDIYEKQIEKKHYFEFKQALLRETE